MITIEEYHDFHMYLYAMSFSGPTLKREDTVWHKILTGENFDEWASRKYVLIKNFLMNSIMLMPTFINSQCCWRD